MPCHAMPPITSHNITSHHITSTMCVHIDVYTHVASRLLVSSRLPAFPPYCRTPRPKGRQGCPTHSLTERSRTVFCRFHDRKDEESAEEVEPHLPPNKNQALRAKTQKAPRANKSGPSGPSGPKFERCQHQKDRSRNDRKKARQHFQKAPDKPASASGTPRSSKGSKCEPSPTHQQVSNETDPPEKK